MQLGAVLLLVGLGLPAVYFLSYYLSVRGQAKSLDANQGKSVYAIQLGSETVQITTEKEQAEYKWDKLLCAYRVKDCIYLYATAQRAFLIPVRADADRVWGMAQNNMPSERIFDLRNLK